MQQAALTKHKCVHTETDHLFAVYAGMHLQDSAVFKKFQLLHTVYKYFGCTIPNNFVTSKFII